MEGLVSFVFSVLSKIVADEIKDGLLVLASRITTWAAKLLPAGMRERYAEEWQSHLADTTGKLAKTFTACGFVIAALKITYGGKFYKLTLRIVAAMMLVGLAATFFPIWWVVKLLYKWSGDDTYYLWEETNGSKKIKVLVVQARLRTEYLLRNALAFGLEKWNPRATLFCHSYPYCFYHSIPRIQHLAIAFRFFFYPTLIDVVRRNADFKEFFDLSVRCDFPG